jgi:aspartyl aminopeptidase
MTISEKQIESFNSFLKSTGQTKYFVTEEIKTYYEKFNYKTLNEFMNIEVNTNRKTIDRIEAHLNRYGYEL